MIDHYEEHMKAGATPGGMPQTQTEKLREWITETVCIKFDTSCSECLYFNSVTEYPCNNPAIDKILQICKESGLVWYDGKRDKFKEIEL